MSKISLTEGIILSVTIVGSICGFILMLAMPFILPDNITSYHEECIKSHVERQTNLVYSEPFVWNNYSAQGYVYVSYVVNATTSKEVCDQYALVRNATENSK